MRRKHFHRFTPVFTLLLSAAIPLVAGAQEDPAGAFSRIGGENPLEESYRQWAEENDSGGGRRLVLGLGWSKAFSRELSRATGRAEIDLAANTVAVEVEGLEPGAGHDVWLVDNIPGTGKTVMPEAGDRMERVGALEADGSRATLDAALADGFFDTFEVDQVVLTRAGGRPESAGVLFGSPTLFQRRQMSVSFPTMDALVIRGAALFFNEKFNGNGRTCGTCHPAENNFTIDPEFIATLPAGDPLFVAEFVEALSENFEKPALLRGLGLILENTNGFGDLENDFTMRGVPHTLALGTSLLPAPPGAGGLRADRTTTPPDERTGWSGDGAPGSGTLREFAVGAVAQHFPKTLNRTAPADFRFPTDEELDALEAFQLFLGRDADFDIDAMVFRSPVVSRGRDIFVTADTAAGAAGKCSACHDDAGAARSGGFNFNFNTGVEDLPDQPANLLDPANNRPDDGFGRAGDPANRTFNTPPLVEAADTGPFFHNNSVETIEAAVAFYNSEAFNNSPSGRFFASSDTNGVGIRLETTQVVAVAALLRVLNALENIRGASEYADFARLNDRRATPGLLKLALAEVADAREVLDGGGLHPGAVKQLERAQQSLNRAIQSTKDRDRNIAAALRAMAAARAEMVEE